MHYLVNYPESYLLCCFFSQILNKNRTPFSKTNYLPNLT
ncbi:hypothetical protein RC62_4630 [Flavobacterium aquidurense]|uniref:Uncharacterized protein n=1 Tax=Flavobacterium aquidurense TaxID=362413 RepID=A0A0Q0S6P7_9FLAO|nr:hypothetical protein RC62_4630 [Flavobacterium aquidurense]